MRRSRLGPFAVEIPETRRERRRGLLGRNGLEPGCAMLFERARGVHTIGMRFPILVAFLDRHYRVVRTQVVPPGRYSWNLRARHVLELRADERLEVGSALGPTS